MPCRCTRPVLSLYQAYHVTVTGLSCHYTGLHIDSLSRAVGPRHPCCDCAVTDATRSVAVTDATRSVAVTDATRAVAVTDATRAVAVIDATRAVTVL